MSHAQPQKKSFFNMNVDLMHGPILKSLLLFMLPILISNLFQQLYNTWAMCWAIQPLPPLAPAARSTSF